MMLAFETRYCQFQLGVQGYCSPQIEDQRPPFKGKPTLEHILATKPSCNMQFALNVIKKDTKPLPFKRVYLGLSKKDSGRGQLKSMKKFLHRLIDHMDKWESQCCENCRLIFLQHEHWINIERQEMRKLINDLVEPGLRATAFNSAIRHLKLTIQMFSFGNQCITIPQRTKTKQGTDRKEESPEEKNSQYPKRGQRTKERLSKIEE